MNRKRILIALLVQCLAMLSFAQAKFTDNTVVKDTTGKIYTVNAWRQLMSTGEYRLSAEDPKKENSDFIIRKRTEDEQKKFLETLPAPAVSEYFITGRSMANFTGKDLHGNRYKLNDLRGKVVVINFWFIACQPCQQEIPELNKLVAEYRDSNVVFLAVCLDEKSMIDKFLQRKPFDYAIIEDGSYITRLYGITRYPTHVVLDKEGKVVFHTTGYSLATIPWLHRSIASAIK